MAGSRSGSIVEVSTINKNVARKYYDSKHLSRIALSSISVQSANKAAIARHKLLRDIKAAIRTPNIHADKEKGDKEKDPKSNSKSPVPSKERPLTIYIETYDPKDYKTRWLRKVESLSGQVAFVSSLPLYNNWTPVRRNIRAQDETTLRNLPYFGDADTGDFEYLDNYENFAIDVNLDRDNVNFLTLIQLFTDHGISMDDVRIHQSPSPPESPDARTLAPDRSILISRLIKLLQKVFKRPVTGLIQRWLDSVDGGSPSNSSLSDALDSFTVFFCRQCFTYDCGLHGTKFRPPARKRRRAASPETSRCSPHCYLETHLRGIKVSTNWSKEEIAMAEAAYYVLGLRQHCLVAKILKTKTCAEIYARLEKGGIKIQGPVQEMDLDDKISPNASPAPSIGSGSRKSVKKVDAESHADAQNEYIPCDHPGPCGPGIDCPCYESKMYCEKFCHCTDDCPRRFPGCTCKARNAPCSTWSCECNKNKRECDPDLCLSCGARDPLEATPRCTNVGIQRDMSKAVLMGPSEIAGWGLFLGEPVRKNEYIGEYTGEVITQSEAERRGKIYDITRTSFLFNLNKELVVDATRKGNKLRFINHSSTNPNCYARICMSNGDHRIGIYAKEDLMAGTELFFDYSYEKQAMEFVAKEREHGLGIQAGLIKKASIRKVTR